MLKKNIIFLFLSFITLQAFGQETKLNIFISDSNRLKSTFEYKKTHTTLQETANEFNRTKETLTRQGFFNLTIDSTKNTSKQLTYYVSLNQKIDSVVLENHPTKNSIRIPIDQLTSEIKNITNELNTNGQPFSKVKLTNLHTKGKILFAHVYIKKTNNRTIDSIIIHGYTSFPKTFLKHYIKISKGKTLNTQEIASKSENVNKLPFASENKKPEILFKEESTQVHLYYKKKNSNYFDGYIGFGNNEDQDKFIVNGSVNIQLNNNLNIGETLKIYWNNNGSDRSEFEGSLNLPYLFNSKLSTNLALNLTRQDSTFNNTHITIEEAYNINNKNTFGVFYKNINSTNATKNNNSIADYQSNFFGLSYYHNNNNFINPLLQKKQLHINIAAGNRNSSQNKTSQQLITLSGLYQHNITKNSKIFIQNNTKALLSSNYLNNELYYFGGINSIRGFAENSISATFYSTVNLEYRQILSNKLYIHSITDYNYNENHSINSKNHLYSIGFGLGILNNQSIFRLNYALGWNTDSTSSLNDSKLHISYSAFF